MTGVSHLCYHGNNNMSCRSVPAAGVRLYGINNEHVVKVVEWPWIKEATLTISFKQQMNISPPASPEHGL